MLSSGGKPGAKLLEKRMRETAGSILGLRNQQRLLAGMLSRIASGNPPPAVDKELWVEMLQAAGMDQNAMNRWHTEFERRAPEGHNEFLISLGIPQEEVAMIRRWSRGEGTWGWPSPTRHFKRSNATMGGPARLASFSRVRSSVCMTAPKTIQPGAMKRRKLIK